MSANDTNPFFSDGGINILFEEMNKGLRNVSNCFKRALSDPIQFLATESPLKVMKNVFHFT